MLTAKQIEMKRNQVRTLDRQPLVLARSDTNSGLTPYLHGTRDEWLEILDLAAMAARIRER